MLSIIIPTLNAAQGLAAALDSLGATGDPVVVVDGGSTDQTVAIAKARGARVIQVPPGRGGQLAAGAGLAETEFMLFLHADTRLGPDWRAAVSGFLADPDSRNHAAFFGFRLDDPSPAARRLERIVDWRCRTFGLPYGDQGLLIGRGFYERLGGYRSIPIMEDVDLVRRIGGERLVRLPADAVTSAARYQRGGYWARPLRNLACLGLYFLGVSPQRIRALYQ